MKETPDVFDFIDEQVDILQSSGHRLVGVYSKADHQRLETDIVYFRRQQSVGAISGYVIIRNPKHQSACLLIKPAELPNHQVTEIQMTFQQVLTGIQ